jgi:ABC-type uncharacterized transport system substrate-binding protein
MTQLRHWHHTTKILSIPVSALSKRSSEFRDALSALGWIEGKNVIYERRYAENRPERLPELVAELIRLNVDVIVATATLAPIAANRATHRDRNPRGPALAQREH